MASARKTRLHLSIIRGYRIDGDTVTIPEDYIVALTGCVPETHGSDCVTSQDDAARGVHVYKSYGDSMTTPDGLEVTITALDYLRAGACHDDQDPSDWDWRSARREWVVTFDDLDGEDVATYMAARSQESYSASEMLAMADALPYPKSDRYLHDLRDPIAEWAAMRLFNRSNVFSTAMDCARWRCDKYGHLHSDYDPRHYMIEGSADLIYAVRVLYGSDLESLGDVTVDCLSGEVRENCRPGARFSRPYVASVRIWEA